MANFRKVGERTIHEGAVINLAVGTFEAPDGTTFEREIVRHPGAVSVVAVDGTGRVPLVRQYRAAIDDWLLELPAGKLDVDGEDPELCARRELAEEVGLEAAVWSTLARFHHSPGFCDEVGTVYLATGLRDVAHDRQGIEEQAMTIEWVLLATVPELIADGAVHDAKTCIGLLLARERVQ